MTTRRRKSASANGHLLIKAVLVVSAVVFIAQQVSSSSVNKRRLTRSLPIWLSNVTHVEADASAASRLNQVLARVGPNMRASSDYNDYKDIKLNESILAWKFLHNQALKIAQTQVDHYAPQLESLMRKANVSQKCSRSIHWLLKGMRNLDSRAIQSKYLMFLF